MNHNLKNNHVLCCDWGTSSFRLRLVARNDYSIIAEFLSSNGVASIFNDWKKNSNQSRFDFYSAFLRDSIQELAAISSTNLDNIPLIVSGMASSTLGMEELPYAELPFDIFGKNSSVKIFRSFNGDSPLLLVSGVKSKEDVMRGEEAQLIGLIKLNEISLNYSDKIIFVFPGTHSKHISVSNGSVNDFETYMTGEIFNIVKEHSILKDSVSADLDPEMTEKSEIDAFLKGVKVAGKSSILHNLFTVRTNQLFKTFSNNENLFYLSGLLIGEEVKGLMCKEFDHLYICCGKNLFEYYKLAFESVFPNRNITFIHPEIMDKATIAGQMQIFYENNDSFNV